MKFGTNYDINYVGIVSQPKKVHQEAPHLETLDKKIEPEIHKTKTKLGTFEQPKKKLSSVNVSHKKLEESKKQDQLMKK